MVTTLGPKMKGIILAAGKGAALYPASMHVSKILLPIYDKPLIYYPLSVLMSAGIRDILIVVTKEDKSYFKKLLGDGKQFGVSIKYVIQRGNKGVGDAILSGERFIDGDMVVVALGDNLFLGDEMYEHLAHAMANSSGASVFCKSIKRQGFCTVDVGEGGAVRSLGDSSSSYPYLATGLYFFDKNVCKYAKKLKSDKKNNTISIDLINEMYLKQGELNAELLEDEVYWAAVSNFDDLLDASNRIYDLEKTSRCMICCPEEIALSRGFITKKQLMEWTDKLKPSPYYDYLRSIV